jgi:hypothetical protein
MRGKKVLLIIIGLVLLFGAGLVLVLKWRSNRQNITSLAGAPDGSFVVQVEKPLFSLRAPWEIPRAIFGDRDPDLRITRMSPGASFGFIGPKRFELRADGGWDLVIESDGQGRVEESTRLVFPISFGGGHFKFNCRHADSKIGYFITTLRADKIDGNFQLQLTQCKNVVSGKNTSGLPPFTVRGSFKGLPQSAPVKDERERVK